MLCLIPVLMYQEAVEVMKPSCAQVPLPTGLLQLLLRSRLARVDPLLGRYTRSAATIQTIVEVFGCEVCGVHNFLARVPYFITDDAKAHSSLASVADLAALHGNASCGCGHVVCISCVTVLACC